MSKKEAAKLNELYGSDPIAADAKFWGRQAHKTSRRGFLQNAGLVSLSTALGSTIPFARFLPAGLIPAAFSAESAPDMI